MCLPCSCSRQGWWRVSVSCSRQSWPFPPQMDSGPVLLQTATCTRSQGLRRWQNFKVSMKWKIISCRLIVLHQSNKVTLLSQSHIFYISCNFSLKLKICDVTGWTQQDCKGLWLKISKFVVHVLPKLFKFQEFQKKREFQVHPPVMSQVFNFELKLHEI